MPNAIRPNYDQQWLFPPTLEDWLPPDHPARFVREFLRAQPLEELGFPAPIAGPGQPAFAPEVLLGVWLYGYLERIHSTRRLEAACLNQVGFLWLTGLRAPDHTTLWYFFRDHRVALTRLFKQIVKVAVACGQVGLALQAVDGTKLAGVCSRHSVWHREELTRQLAQAAEAAANAAAMEIEQAFQQEADLPSIRLTGALAEATQRVDAIQAALAALDAAETDHLSPTDLEARMMKLGDGPLRLGYNSQVVVDSQAQVIVAAEVVSAQDDSEQLVPMLSAAEATLGAKPEMAVADGSYLSAEQLPAAEASGYSVLVNLGETILPTTPKPFHKTQFSYDAAADVYRCPQGQVLPFSFERRHTQHGYMLKVYRCRCTDCPVKRQCTRGVGPREIARVPHEEALARQRAAQAQPGNRLLLGLRKAVVEPVFAQIKQHMGFRRFTVWGLPAVRAQWALVCSAYNLRRLFQRWQQGHWGGPALGILA